MKTYILLLFLLFISTIHSNHYDTTLDVIINTSENQIERKLSDEEIKERGLDVLATEIIEQIDEIDLRKMARSTIFETSYGFRWKMINLHTGNIIIVKVDKDFGLISARNSKQIK